MNDIKVFSGKFSKDLTDKICKKYDGREINKMKLTRFSDGEFITDISETVRGCDVFVVSSLIPPGENIWELLMIGDALKRASSNKIIAICPYIGYSRQDRKCNPREPIGAKLLSDVIQTAGFDRLITIDLHNDSIQGFYNIPVDHLSSSYIFVPYLKSLKLSNIIFGSPDVGGGKRAKKYADIFGTDFILCHKSRPKPNEIGEMKLIGDVKNKDVILVDDLIDTAGTICKSADLIMEKGANSVRALITHPILSGNAYENIKNSKITELIVTDTIPLKQECDKITVLSVDNMISQVISKIKRNESISQAFDVK